MKDEKTIEYFDKETPEFSLERLDHALSVINKNCHDKSSLIDIGCGTGNLLKYISDNTALNIFYGIDVSKKCLLKTHEKVNCTTICGSILDSQFIKSINQKFDIALMGAVLHHLIGKNRKESKSNAILAIMNAIKLLRNNGLLIIIEPVFYPPAIMDILFLVKKHVSKITSKRIEIFGKWNNIGAPVVSYYTNEELFSMIEQINNCKIVDQDIKEKKVGFIMKLFGISRRVDTTIIVQKIWD